jgi:hypothetical protein
MASLWTLADIATLSAACSSGITNVTYSGPPQRSVTYQNLASMLSLLAQMRAEFAVDSGQSRFKVAVTNKGLQ